MHVPPHLALTSWQSCTHTHPREWGATLPKADINIKGSITCVWIPTTPPLRLPLTSQFKIRQLVSQRSSIHRGDLPSSRNILISPMNGVLGGSQSKTHPGIHQDFLNHLIDRHSRLTFYVLDLWDGDGVAKEPKSLESENIGLLCYLPCQTKMQQTFLAYQLVLAMFTEVILFNSILYMIDVETGTQKM